MRLVERAKALLSHAVPSGALGELHLRAMRLLVSELEKRKYAVTAQPLKTSREAAVTSPSLAAPGAEALAREPEGAEPRRRVRYVR